VRCKACNKIQKNEEVRLYDDLCRNCYEVATRPDEEHEDHAQKYVLWDQGWEKDDE